MTAAQIIDNLALAELDEAIATLGHKAYGRAQDLSAAVQENRHEEWRAAAADVAEIGSVLLNLAEVQRAIHDHAEQVAQ